jgi:undecaprenyl phosphate-alpha-L-ara4N flippase subunit ArnE
VRGVWPYYAALGAGILLGAAGQVLLKEGAGTATDTFLQQVLRPHTLIGLALYGLAAFLYIVALRKLPVSVAFLTGSLSYAVVAMLGHVLFGESFGLPKIAGLVLIMAGVWLVHQG